MHKDVKEWKKKHAGQTFQQSCVAAEMLIELKDET